MNYDYDFLHSIVRQVHKKSITIGHFERHIDMSLLRVIGKLLMMKILGFCLLRILKIKIAQIPE